MTLPSSGSLSLSAICAEYGVASNTAFPSGFYGKPGFPSSGVWSFSQCYGLSNVLFTPNGGVFNVVGNPASHVLSCNVAAVWTYTGGGTGGTVDVASGGSATSITFTLTNPNPNSERVVTWNVTGVAAGITRNFTITLDSINGTPP